MRIFFCTPWNSDKNIGKSYNQMMSLVDMDDWVCFLDGDAVYTSHFFGKRIEDVIMANPEYSMFTCMTNRVNCLFQIAPNVDKESNDQKYHRIFGESIWEKYGNQVLDITHNKVPSKISGVLILIKKSEWLRVGGFKEKGMLGVDGDMHLKFEKLEGKVGLMQGIYVQHWYRGGKKKDKSHLL